MLSLTVNTSSSLGSMVVGSGRAIVGEIEWHKEKSHSEKITVMLEELLKKSGKKLSDLELLICGHGPGSFTGLRVGLSVTKTLAYSLGLPIIAVDDCFALALNMREKKPAEPVVTLIDAQKNKVFAGIYEIRGDENGVGKIIPILKPALLSLEELNQQLKKDRYACVGDGYKAYESFFASDLAKKISYFPSMDEPRAQKIFQYVSEFPTDFQKIKWPELSALYLRASAAEEVLADKLSKK